MSRRDLYLSPDLRRSLVEAFFYALMVGLGEVYFVAAAVRLGADPIELGLVVGLPLAAGGLGSLVALALLARRLPRRGVVVLAVSLQIVVLAALTGLALGGRLTPTTLIALACGYHLAGMGGGTAWSSWYGDLVPEDIRGRFFSRRNRVVQIATCIGLVGGGLGLQWLEPAVESDAARLPGFAVLFAVATAARVVSLVLLARSHEPRFSGLGTPRRLLRFLRTDKGSIAWRVLVVGAALQLTAYLASPFFAPYMLRELSFTYGEYMVATLVVVLAKIAVLPRWGGLLDEFGPRRAYSLAAVMVAIVPLPWLWAEGLAWVVVAQIFSGLSWAAHEVAFFTLLLDTSYRRTRPQVFASQTVLNGSAQFLGSLLGGLALAGFGGRWVWLFGLSLVLRLAVALSVPALIRRLGVEPRTRRRLAMRLVGMRPHAGPVFRPVWRLPEPPRDGDEEE